MVSEVLRALALRNPTKQETRAGACSVTGLYCKVRKAARAVIRACGQAK